jgi:hypothetical protein
MRPHIFHCCHSSSATDHRSTVCRSMSSELAYSSLSIHCWHRRTGCCHNVDHSIVSSDLVEITHLQSDHSVWSLWHFHRCSCPTAFSVRLANQWFRMDSRCKESSAVFGSEPSCLLSSNLVSFCSRTSSFVHFLRDTLLLLLVYPNNYAFGYQEAVSH